MALICTQETSYFETKTNSIPSIDEQVNNDAEPIRQKAKVIISGQKYYKQNKRNKLMNNYEH